MVFWIARNIIILAINNQVRVFSTGDLLLDWIYFYFFERLMGFFMAVWLLVVTVKAMQFQGAGHNFPPRRRLPCLRRRNCSARGA